MFSFSLFQGAECSFHQTSWNVTCDRQETVPNYDQKQAAGSENRALPLNMLWNRQIDRQ
jgi:hypothetical protein